MKLQRICVWLLMGGILLLVGCVDNKLVYPLDTTSFAIASKADICHAKRILMQFEPGDTPPPEMRGGTLFDGVVLNIANHSDKSQEVLIRVERALLADSTLPSIVTISTPAATKGGVNFDVGRKYRVFAIMLRDKYYTWVGTGTFEIDGDVKSVSCPE